MNKKDLIFGLAHIGIMVPDLDEAVAFYRDLFGFEVVQTNLGDDGKPHIIFLNKYGVVLELIRILGDTTANVAAANATPNHVALACADTKAFMAFLKEKGIACETETDKYVENFGGPDTDIDVVFLHGPGGERVEVFQKITK